MMQSHLTSIMQGRWKAKLVSLTSHGDESVSEELPLGASGAKKKLEIGEATERGWKMRRSIKAGNPCSSPASTTEMRLRDNK